MCSSWLGCCFSKAKNPSANNQDSIMSPVKTRSGLVFAVADGVGGDNGGGVASAIAINEVVNIFLSSSSAIKMKAVFANVRQKLADAAENDSLLCRMGTTLSVCVVDGNMLRVGHTGDCRVYIISGGVAKQITKDHTEIQELIDGGVFTEEQLNGYPRKNVLTSALSPTDYFKMDEYLHSLNKMDIVLVVSDGVSKKVNIDERTWKAEKTPFSVCSNLLNSIEESGPIDDYSAICFQYL